jgi:hypothetical protein
MHRIAASPYTLVLMVSTRFEDFELIVGTSITSVSVMTFAYSLITAFRDSYYLDPGSTSTFS